MGCDLKSQETFVHSFRYPKLQLQKALGTHRFQGLARRKDAIVLGGDLPIALAFIMYSKEDVS